LIKNGKKGYRRLQRKKEFFQKPFESIEGTTLYLSTKDFFVFLLDIFILYFFVFLLDIFILLCFMRSLKFFRRFLACFTKK